MMKPFIHTIADAVGHADLNTTRVVFGPPDNMLPETEDYPLVDPRGLVIAQHRDFPPATPDEFIAILEALLERWPDRTLYLWGDNELTVIGARLH